MGSETLDARVQALEARLQEVEDDRAIRELLSRYGYWADMGRDQDYVDLYTEDGVMNLGVGSGAYSGGIRRWEGQRELMEFITDPKAHKAICGRCMHVQGNNLSTYIKGDEAIAESYSIVLVREGDRLVVQSAGYNRWTLRKVDGRWLIKERRRREVAGTEYDQVLTGAFS